MQRSSGFDKSERIPTEAEIKHHPQINKNEQLYQSDIKSNTKAVIIITYLQKAIFAYILQEAIFAYILLNEIYYPNN